MPTKIEKIEEKWVAQKINCEHHGEHSETMELPCTDDARSKDLYCAKCISEWFTMTKIPKVKKGVKA